MLLHTSQKSKYRKCHIYLKNFQKLEDFFCFRHVKLNTSLGKKNVFWLVWLQHLSSAQATTFTLVKKKVFSRDVNNYCWKKNAGYIYFYKIVTLGFPDIHLVFRIAAPVLRKLQNCWLKIASAAAEHEHFRNVKVIKYSPLDCLQLYKISVKSVSPLLNLKIRLNFTLLCTVGYYSSPDQFAYILLLVMSLIR